MSNATSSNYSWQGDDDPETPDVWIDTLCHPYKPGTEWATDPKIHTWVTVIVSDDAPEYLKASAHKTVDKVNRTVFSDPAWVTPESLESQEDWDKLHQVLIDVMIQTAHQDLYDGEQVKQMVGHRLWTGGDGTGAPNAGSEPTSWFGLRQWM